MPLYSELTWAPNNLPSLGLLINGILTSALKKGRLFGVKVGVVEFRCRISIEA